MRWTSFMVCKKISNINAARERQSNYWALIGSRGRLLRFHTDLQLPEKQEIKEKSQKPDFCTSFTSIQWYIALPVFVHAHGHLCYVRGSWVFCVNCLFVRKTANINFKKTYQFINVVCGVSHSPKTTNIVFIGFHSYKRIGQWGAITRRITILRTTSNRTVREVIVRNFVEVLETAKSASIYRSTYWATSNNYSLRVR